MGSLRHHNFDVAVLASVDHLEAGPLSQRVGGDFRVDSAVRVPSHAGSPLPPPCGMYHLSTLPGCRAHPLLLEQRLHCEADKPESPGPLSDHHRCPVQELKAALEQRCAWPNFQRLEIVDG